MSDTATEKKAGKAGLPPKGSYSESAEDLARYSVDNPVQSYGVLPLAVTKPETVKDLQDTIKTVDRPDVGLVPVSSGASHVKTGICCRKDHIIVDLSGWKDIPFVSRRNRVAQIEPGVTYPQLLKKLEPMGLTIPMPLAPKANKSVLAVCCERQPVTWGNKQWDNSDPMACMEFIFGSGELFRTGAAGGPGSLEEQRSSGQAQKAPLGPGATDFHRLIQGSQGSFGVATWVSVRLELKPSIETPHLLGVKNLPDLFEYIYATQRVKLGEQSFVLNRTAAAMLLSHNKGHSFDDIYDSLPEYICLQNIAGFERLAEERMEYHTQDIKKIAQRNLLKLSKKIGCVSANELLDTSRSDCGESDWRHSYRGNCLSIIFQATLNRTHLLIETARTTLQKHGITDKEMGIYIQPVNQNRACEVEIMIPYNPTLEDQVALLKTIEIELYQVLNEAHAFFSRPYGVAELRAFENNPQNTEFLVKLKDIFDPEHRLNPGKFGL